MDRAQVGAGWLNSVDDVGGALQLDRGTVKRRLPARHFVDYRNRACDLVRWLGGPLSCWKNRLRGASLCTRNCGHNCSRRELGVSESQGYFSDRWARLRLRTAPSVVSGQPDLFCGQGRRAQYAEHFAGFPQRTFPSCRRYRDRSRFNSVRKAARQRVDARLRQTDGRWFPLGR